MPPSGVPGPKRRSPWVWVAVGCGTLLLICVIAFAAVTWWAARKVKQFADNPEMKTAELIVRANPDLELISTDEANGLITVRNKQTGETITLSLNQIKEGKFELEKNGEKTTIGIDAEKGIAVTGPDGKATFQMGGNAAVDRPSWVPVYPGSETPQNLMSASTDESSTGSFSQETSDASDKVAGYYKEQLVAQGLKIETEGTFGPTTMVVAKSEDGGRTVSVNLSPRSGGGTTAVITYVEKKTP